MYFILFIGLFITVYFLTESIDPPKTLKRRLNDIKKINSKRVDYNKVFVERFLKPSLEYLLKYSKLDFFKFESINRKLRKLNRNESAEEFLAKGILVSIALFIAGIIIQSLTHLSTVSVIIYVLAIAAIFAPIFDLNNKIKEKNQKIIDELPRFVKTVLFQYRYKVPLVSIIKSYIDVAGDELKAELIKLYADLEILPEEKALRNFSDRLQIIEVQSFVNTLINAYSGGVDVEQLFLIQDKEIRTLNRDNIRKKLKNLPNKLTVYLFLPILGFMLIFAVPAILFIFVNTKF
jgi:tight adherence protein C